MCVCVSVLLLPLLLPLAVNAFGLRCSRSYYVHFVPQLPQRVARSRYLSLALSLSLPLSLSLFCSLCVFFTGHAPDGSLMTERMTRVHSTSTSPSVRPELLPLPACGKVLLPCCLLFFYFVATLSLGINC